MFDKEMLFSCSFNKDRRREEKNRAEKKSSRGEAKNMNLLSELLMKNNNTNTHTHTEDEIERSKSEEN